MKKKLVALIMTGILAAGMLTGCGNGGNSGGTESVAVADAGDNSQDGNSAAEADAGNQAVNTEAGKETQYPITVKDNDGFDVTLDREPQTIVTLAPAQTEIVCALGAMDRLVGRSEIDDYPADVMNIVSVGAYYEPNVEMIVSLAPELVISANYMEDDVRAQLEAAGAAVYMCYDSGIDAAENNILQIGQLINASEKAEEIVAGMETTRQEMVAACASEKEQKSVFIDIGDYYSAGPGSLLDNMLTELNCVNIAGDSDTTWPQLSAEQIIAADPQVYISLFSTVEEIKAMPGFDAISAVTNDQVYYFDMFSDEANMIQRSGPRLCDGLKVLAETIYGL